MGLTYPARGQSRLEMRPKRYPLVIERTGTGYSAYSPDVPGCAAVGDTEQEQGAVAVRLRDGTNLGPLPLSEVIERLTAEKQTPVGAEG